MSDAAREAQQVTAEVTVDADPELAFKVFTEEMHLWWQQGAVNFYDSARAIENRMEPGVGGRIVEVYDATTGDGLELARITEWEPGARLAFTGSLDDVHTVVTFSKVGSRTRVEVVATIPADGKDEGGSSIIRMTPVWFGGWMSRRSEAKHEPVCLSRVMTTIRYRQPARMARWLRDAYGFLPASDIPDEDSTSGGHHRYELHVGNSPIVLHEHDDSPQPGTFESWISVDDLEARRDIIAAAGGEVSDIHTYGARLFTTVDPEGLQWTFVQASPRQMETERR